MIFFNDVSLSKMFFKDVSFLKIFFKDVSMYVKHLNKLIFPSQKVAPIHLHQTLILQLGVIMEAAYIESRTALFFALSEMKNQKKK